ncbi:hypothetical protein IFM89_036389 [Coptis chinensis]|uniref:Hcy-binding domain-containing protein n=1 Tax=Coptis chinensis TaxID=261450 RepID=A0A835IKQ0_9MAGN|nr:hypothetical protein IFM89_036389 [Coptis chinensis]
MSNFLQQSGGYALIDGGLATELEQHGADLNDLLWSAKYLISSPHLIQTATIQEFESKGLSKEDSEALLQRSVKIACEARDTYYERCAEHLADGTKNGKILKHRPILVAASVGSYGAYLADGSEYEYVTLSFFKRSKTFSSQIRKHKQELE